MDLKTLYTQILNEHNVHPTHKGVLEDATLTLQGVNPSCGDSIYVQLKIDDARLSPAAPSTVPAAR